MSCEKSTDTECEMKAGAAPRPGGPEWGPRPGRGSGRYGGERMERDPRRARRPRLGSWRPRAPRRPRPPLGRTMGMPRLRALAARGRSPADPKRDVRRGAASAAARRVRKGDVRAAILDLLAEGGQWNGYQLIQEIAGRTSGVWRPSAGSVYPALQQLEDEGLIAPEGEGRRRMYTLTDAGRAYARGARGRAERLLGRGRRDDRRRRHRVPRPDPPGHDGGDGGAARGLRRPARPGACRARAGPPLAVPDPGRGRARHGGRGPPERADGHRRGYTPDAESPRRTSRTRTGSARVAGTASGP